MKQLDATIGVKKVRVIHANDSKTAFGSHADRHEHIGKGQIGAEAFAPHRAASEAEKHSVHLRDAGGQAGR